MSGPGQMSFTIRRTGTAAAHHYPYQKWREQGAPRTKPHSVYRLPVYRQKGLEVFSCRNKDESSPLRRQEDRRTGMEVFSTRVCKSVDVVGYLRSGNFSGTMEVPSTEIWKNRSGAIADWIEVVFVLATENIDSDVAYQALPLSS